MRKNLMVKTDNISCYSTTVTMYITGFVKFIGIQKTSPSYYDVTYLSDPMDNNSNTFSIIFSPNGYSNIWVEDIDQLGVLGQIIEPVPYSNMFNITNVLFERFLTEEQRKMINRTTIINKIIES